MTVKKMWILLVAVVVVVGVVFGVVVSKKNTEITNLNDQISQLNAKVDELTAQVAAETAAKEAAEAAAKAAAKTSIAVCIASEPDTLDPALNSSVDGATMAAHLFSGLATWAQKEDGTLEIVAECAVELSEPVTNEDGTVTYLYLHPEGRPQVV